MLTTTETLINHLNILREALQRKIDAIDALLAELLDETPTVSPSPNRQRNSRREALEQGRARARAWAQQHHA